MNIFRIYIYIEYTHVHIYCIWHILFSFFVLKKLSKLSEKTTQSLPNFWRSDWVIFGRHGCEGRLMGGENLKFLIERMESWRNQQKGEKNMEKNPGFLVETS